MVSVTGRSRLPSPAARTIAVRGGTIIRGYAEPSAAGSGRATERSGQGAGGQALDRGAARYAGGGRGSAGSHRASPNRGKCRGAFQLVWRRGGPPAGRKQRR